MSITYRSATLEDAPAVAALHARSWRENYRGAYRDVYLDGPIDEERRAVWTERFAEPPPNQFVVVAEDENGLVGFACVYGGRDAEGSFLDNLHVDPDHHREGIGSGLLAEVVEWCRERYGDQGLHLKVLSPNTGARRFYDRFGGEDRGSTPPDMPWVVEDVEVRQIVWPTLDAVTRRP